MKTCCYEIGGDVFSLVELSACIIRGNMAAPIGAKPPYIDAPKKSSSYRRFALKAYSPILNFVLNTGDLSCPRGVPVLRSDRLEEQVADHAASFLRKNVSVDTTKKLILLPRVCEVYRNDFSSETSSGTAMSCLRFCLPYLDDPISTKIQEMLREEDEESVAIRFHQSADQYRSMLGPSSVHT